MSPRFLLTFATALGAVAAQAADDPLSALPAEAGVVLRLSPPAELSGKAKAFLNKAAPRFAGLADQIGPGLGSIVGNPTLAGVDAGRDWYAGVLPRATGRPAVLFAIPTSDAAALRQAVGAGYTFADHEAWVLYSLDADAMKGVQDRVAAAPARAAMTEALRGVFAEGEIGIFLDVPVLREAYRAQLDRAKEQFLAGVAAATPDADSNPQAKAGLEYNRKAFEAFLQAIDDTAGVAAHWTIGENSVDLDALAAVAPDSASASFLAKQSASPFPLLAKLPRGRVLYFGLSGDFSDLIAASAGISLGAQPENEELKKKMEELQKFTFHEVAGLFEFGDVEKGVYRGVSLTKVDEPERYLALARELAKSMGHIETPGLQQDVTLKPEAETIEGVKVDRLQVVMTPDPNKDPTGASQKFLELFFGKEGMTQRMAVVDGLFLQAVGEGVAEPAIRAAKGESVGDETAHKAAEATRTRLGDSANLLLIYDLPRLIGGAVQLAVASRQLPLPIDPQAIENLNLPPGYTGITVTAGKDEVRLRGIMPAEQVRGLVELFGVLQQAAPRRNRAN